MSLSYSVLAKYYDQLMGDFPYQKYADYILQNTQGTKGLDLFCGSGKMTILLSQSGRIMQGVDHSKEMLNLATASARDKGQRIIFCNEQAQHFEFGERYDFVTAVCDGINYVPSKKSGDLFSKIYSALEVGGTFVFDISTSYKLQEILSDNVFFEDYEDYTYIWHNQLSEKRDKIDMYLTFFVKNGEQYTRLDETHTQYIYTKQQLIDLLVAQGFEVMDIVDGNTFSRATATSERLIFLAKKNI